jgi:hypothetical protein
MKNTLTSANTGGNPGPGQGVAVAWPDRMASR